MKKPVVRKGTPAFDKTLDQLCRRGAEDAAGVEPAVREIIDAVAREGDRALRDYTERFDGWRPGEIRVPEAELEAAWRALSEEDRRALELAAERIQRFHERQVPGSWFVEEPDGVVLGQRITPLEAVGIYVPGGTAAYPSSVFMNALPARVAGVERIVMVSPCPGGRTNPQVLAAAWIAGVREVYRVGGAQAVAALAFGTETVPRVDKIVGPGNIYVATAKRLLYGRVDIDMVAGPSEILVVSDGSGDPAWIAADLLSQAEHDPLATAALVCTDGAFAASVCEEVEAQLARLPRAETARESWQARGSVLVVDTLEEACEVANRVAPEHLELAVERPWELLGRIRHAGAIFLGLHTPEALGDYAAGPNHVLPTSGTARFYSPLGVEDFVKRSSVLAFSREALQRLAGPVVRIARLEGLEAHARAVERRIEG